MAHLPERFAQTSCSSGAAPAAVRPPSAPEVFTKHHHGTVAARPLPAIVVDHAIVPLAKPFVMQCRCGVVRRNATRLLSMNSTKRNKKEEAR
jgi:hypothetical protein